MQTVSARSGYRELPAKGKAAGRATGKNHVMAGPPDMRPALDVRCGADLDEVRHTLQHIHNFLSKHALPSDLVEDLDLVLSEAMTNIVLHGNTDANGLIECQLVLRDTAVECRLSDTGVAFDPAGAGLAAPEAKAFSEGGYGWFLIRSLTCQISYARKGAWNVLCFSMRSCAGCGAERCWASRQ